MSTDIESSDDGDDQPRFTKSTRVRIALSKAYGLDGEEWTRDEIADYLNVSSRQVDRYIDDSEMGEDMRRMLEQRQATTRMKLMRQMQEKLDRLNEIEEQVAEEVEVVPSMYRMKEAEVEIDPSKFDGLKAVDDDVGGTVTTMDIPVPTSFTEVPNVEELSDIWREQRLVKEQLEDLMGLEEPEEIKAESEKTVDVKHWSMDDDGLPDAEVVDVDGGEIEDE